MKPNQQVFSIWTNYDQHFHRHPTTTDRHVASQLAANILCAGPAYYYICELGLRTFSYVSPGLWLVLGADPNSYQLQDLVERVHPDDLPFMARCEELAASFLFERTPPDKMKQYKFSYPLRMRHDDGRFRLILHQAMTIEQDGFGRLSKVLGVHTDISHLVPSMRRRMSVIGMGGEPSYLGIDVYSATDPFGPAPIPHPFTERELQVIRLFAEGRTAAEVGDVLHLATGTVRTHRRNILQKSDCANMTAVVATCIKEGWV